MRYVADKDLRFRNAFRVFTKSDKNSQDYMDLFYELYSCTRLGTGIGFDQIEAIVVEEIANQ